MRHTATQSQPPATTLTPAAPWSLRAWPTLLWQAGEPTRVTFRHLGTRVMPCACTPGNAVGQTIWTGSGADGEAGMAWDWVQLCRGVVAMADPLAVVTNVRLIGSEGAVLSAHEAARFLNDIVHTLPWQMEVHKALGARVN